MQSQGCVPALGNAAAVSSVHEGNADMNHRIGLIISHAQGMRCDAGFAVLALML